MRNEAIQQLRSFPVLQWKLASWLEVSWHGGVEVGVLLMETPRVCALVNRLGSEGTGQVTLFRAWILPESVREKIESLGEPPNERRRFYRAFTVDAPLDPDEWRTLMYGVGGWSFLIALDQMDGRVTAIYWVDREWNAHPDIGL